MLTLFGIVAGCTSSSPFDDASIALVEPVDGAVVCGSPLRVEVDVSGIELVDPYPSEPVEPQPGTGHVDVALNGQDLFMTKQVAFDVEDVDAGEWQLKVELSNADHTPIDPYAGDFVYLTVDPQACP